MAKKCIRFLAFQVWAVQSKKRTAERVHRVGRHFVADEPQKIHDFAKFEETLIFLAKNASRIPDILA
jgi:hypothetical protein